MYIDTGTLLAVLLLALLLAAGWFWSDSLRARERMLETCSRLCRESGLQFLDETVTLAGLSLGRSAKGWPEFTRRYVFEFSGTGQDRWQGRATLAGQRVISLQFDQPEGVTILGAGETVSSKKVVELGQYRPPGSQHRLH